MEIDEYFCHHILREIKQDYLHQLLPIELIKNLSGILIQRFSHFVKNCIRYFICYH